MASAPDRIYMDRADRELYDRLKNEPMFENRSRKEQFLLAMAIGFRNGAKREFSKKENLFLLKDCRAEDEALMFAVAVADTGDAKVVVDRARVFEIAEQYAHAGLKLLIDKVESAAYGGFEARFEKELRGPQAQQDD